MAEKEEPKERPPCFFDKKVIEVDVAGDISN